MLVLSTSDVSVDLFCFVLLQVRTISDVPGPLHGSVLDVPLIRAANTMLGLEHLPFS